MGLSKRKVDLKNKIRDAFHPLFHSRNDQTRTYSSVQVSHMSTGVQAHEPSPTAFPGASGASWSGEGAAGVRMGARTECHPDMQQLNPAHQQCHSQN